MNTLCMVCVFSIIQLHFPKAIHSCPFHLTVDLGWSEGLTGNPQDAKGTLHDVSVCLWYMLPRRPSNSTLGRLPGAMTWEHSGWQSQLIQEITDPKLDAPVEKPPRLLHLPWEMLDTVRVERASEKLESWPTESESCTPTHVNEQKHTAC